MAKKKTQKVNYHPSNASNSLVKSVLSIVSEEINSYQKLDKEFIKKFFNNKCAYTGVDLKKNNIEYDHIIPANINNGGLTLLGNIVPTTKEINRKKTGKNFEIFLQDEKMHSPEVISKIKSYQELFCYPVNFYSDDIRDQLQQLVSQINEVTNNFIENLIEKLNDDNDIKNISRLTFEEKSQVFKVFNNFSKWMDKKSIPYKIVNLYFEHKEKGVVDYESFKKDLKTKKITNLSNLINLKTNNYGKIFDIKGNDLILWKPISDFVENHYYAQSK